MEKKADLRRIPAQEWKQRAASDPRPPTRYEVLVDGAKVGEVYSYSRESWDRSRSGKIRTRFRGYSRMWRATSLDGTLVASFSDTRRDAVRKLLASLPTPGPATTSTGRRRAG